MDHFRKATEILQRALAEAEAELAALTPAEPTSLAIPPGEDVDVALLSEHIDPEPVSGEATRVGKRGSK